MNRKEFIRNCGLACAGGLTFPALLSGCATANYVAQHTVSSDKILVKKSEFLKVSKNKTVMRNFILVRPEGNEFPVCVIHLGNDNYSALLMKCTHKGCELQPQGTHLVCPCHGSEFNNKGVVQSPPADVNLQTFNVTTDNENIILQL
jgi:cytochrome b6-f complex iron-sulfur subunit